MAQSPRSYADAARTPENNASGETSPGPLAYSVNRQNTGMSTEAPHRGSIITIEEPTRPSRDLTRLHNAGASPPTSRRPSIAQVLGRSLSRSSRVSDALSGPSSSYNLTTVPEQEDAILSRPSRKKKRSRPKNRRRKSSKTRDHADFLVSHARGTVTRASKLPDKTPLLSAITSGDVDRVEELLSEETSINDTTSNPLQTAALGGDENIVRLLLESNNFDIDGHDVRDRTAIYAATSRGHQGIVRLLLDNGATPLSSEESRIADLELKRWLEYRKQIDDHDDATPQKQQTLEGADYTTEPEDTTTSDNPPTTTQTTTAIRPESRDIDHLYRLVVGSAENIKEMEEAANLTREEAQKRGEWVYGPMKPSPLPTQRDVGTQQKHIRYPGFGFEIPVVEWDFTLPGGHRIVSPTPLVDDLLYGARGVDSIAKGSGPASQATCKLTLPYRLTSIRRKFVTQSAV